MSVNLTKFASEGKSWIKLEDGGSLEGIYVDVTEGVYESGHAKGKKFITYHFDIDGEVKTFSAASQRLAGNMASQSFGTKLKITKRGTGTSTIYELEVLGGSSFDGKTYPSDPIESITKKAGESIKEDDVQWT